MYEDILENAKSQKNNHAVFLKKLGSQNVPEFHDLLVRTHESVFSKIDCLQCANCCKSTPPLINTTDIKRISKHLNLSPKQFKRQYILEDVNGEMSFNFVPCSFLNEDNTCQIYEIRPEACKGFPHTDEKDFAKRYKLNLANTLICPAAAQIVEILQTKIKTL